jgi:hypothetical protein
MDEAGQFSPLEPLQYFARCAMIRGLRARTLP